MKFPPSFLLFTSSFIAYVQALSVIFGLIKMSMSAESYQRFESQKNVGKNYPWLAPHQIVTQKTTFRRTLSAPDGNRNPNVSSVTENNKNNSLEDARKSLNVNRNNFNDTNGEEKSSSGDGEAKKIDFVRNITDDDKLKNSTDSEIDTNRPSTSKQNFADEDLLGNIDEIKEYLRRTANEMDEIDTPTLRNINNVDFDRVPSHDPPPTPHPYISGTFNRLSTFKDMLIFNAESFIKDKIPRIPEGFFEHHNKDENDEGKKKNFSEYSSPQTAFNIEHDGVDDALLLPMPSRRKVVDGIESDDLVAKFISFLGWNFFLIMRLISLSVFSVFYPMACGWLCFAHYCLMLLLLINETRFKVKWQRTAFYTILSYIFIFNIIEFKIRFKSVRFWYIGYFILVMGQNIGMTIAWYGFTEFLDTWWFELMFLVTLQSGIMSLMCFLLYFFYLKPQDRVFFVNE